MPCSGLKVMTKSKTNFCLSSFVNPILSKQKKSELYDKNSCTGKTFLLKLRQFFCLRPFVNPGPGLNGFITQKDRF